MAFAWLGSILWIGFVIMTNRKVHPKALFYLFFVEMWERFSYYGMRALLVLYMVNGFLKYSTEEAVSIYGSYGSLVYATPLLGGLLAERFMGYRRAIMWGAILMMVGHFLMAFEDEAIFLTALAMLILGNGFFKPNISGMIGKFYAKTDPRRDGAFTIFYMGINIGAFLTGLTCGVVGELEGWHWGFSLAGFGMLLGLLILLAAQRSGVLEDKGYAPNERQEREGQAEDEIPVFDPVPNPQPLLIMGINANLFIYASSLLSIPLLWFLIQAHGILDLGLLAIGAMMIAYLVYTSFEYEVQQRHRLWVVLILFFFTIIFWTFFELAGSALTIFTDNNVRKTGFLTTTMFQSLNPFFIMIFAPVFSWIWVQLSKRKIEPPAPVKFGIALILLGSGFLVLNLGSSSAQAGMIPALFMVLLYLLHTLGELALSPVGLSLVTKLAPIKIVGFVMGFWLMGSSFAHQLGAKIAKMTDVDMSQLIQDDTRRLAFEKVLDNPVLVEGFLKNGQLYQLYTKRCDEKDLEQMSSLIQKDSSLLPIAKKKRSVEDFVLSAQYIETLNQNSANTKYFIAELLDQAKLEEADKATNPAYQEKLRAEAKHRFLSDDPQFNTPQPKVLPKAEIETAMANSPMGRINQAVAEDTLLICLSVFWVLGLFAGGAGVFLILISPLIIRLMHKIV